MHGVGVFEYASSGNIESQVYLCPFAHCTEKMMAKGDCLTFISAVAVRVLDDNKQALHTLILRDNSLLVDGQPEHGSKNFQGLSVTPVGSGAAPQRVDHKTLRGCGPDPEVAATGGWLWHECTSNGWRLESPELSITVGAVGPYEEGWLKEDVSGRTFNLDVSDVEHPRQVRGIINGDMNGDFKPAGPEYQNVLQASNVPQVTARPVRPDSVIFPLALQNQMDAKCGTTKDFSATLMTEAHASSMKLMRSP